MTRRYERLALFGAILAIFLFAGYLLYKLDSKQTCKSDLTLRHFDFVHLDMTYDQVLERVGEPSTPGVDMPRYELSDCSQVVLRFMGEELAGVWIQQTDGGRFDFWTGDPLSVPQFDEFAFLERGMPFGKVTDLVGEPNRLGGSGFLRATYELIDGRNLVIQLATRWTGSSVEYVVINAWVGPTEGSMINFFDQ